MKILAIGAGAIAGLGVLTYAGIWVGGELILRKTYKTPDSQITHSDNPAIIERGQHLAAIMGCHGCHGEALNGGVMAEVPFTFRSVAPNLPRRAATYSDADFERAIRHGVRRNGTSVWGMPSRGFAAISDNDLVALISFIRTLPDMGGKLPRDEHWILDRLFLLQHENPMEAAQIDHFAERKTFDSVTAAGRGEYIASIACAECHGTDFKGGGIMEAGAAPPDLVVASAYPADEFVKLMKTGEAVGGRDLTLMDDVARSRFSNFSDSEISDLHQFLVHRAQTMTAD